MLVMISLLPAVAIGVLFRILSTHAEEVEDRAGTILEIRRRWCEEQWKEVEQELSNEGYTR